MESVRIFEGRFKDLIQNGISNLQLENAETATEVERTKQEWSTSNSANLACSYCHIEFTNPHLYHDHYKLDWHRYNLKQSLLNRPPLTEEQFDNKADDLSSISGSESEKEDNLDSLVTAQGKIFLTNASSQVLSLYKCILFVKKEEIQENVLTQRLQALHTNNQWTVLMLGGGHFAGAIFQDDNPILHKTFHCYTVRAGQGSAQGTRDNRSGGSHPKSAGASLRRYNETALVQHVKDIIEAWKPEIEKSHLIVFRAVGPYNRTVLFGGKSPLLNRSDPRLRTVPFSTRRATFTEVKRVHYILTSVSLYASLDSVIELLHKQKIPENDSKRNKVKLSNINRAKSREIMERKLPATISSSSSENDICQTVESNTELVSEEEEILLQDVLETFGDSLSLEQRKRAPRKKKNPKKSKSRKLREQEECRKKEIFEIIKTGNKEKIDVILKTLQEDGENRNEKEIFINQVLDEHSNSLLHIAANCEQGEVIKLLLDNGANPCLKNDKQQTPYTCTPNKDIRDIFKQFAQDFPDKYNYNKAQIPTNVLTTEEQSEKKRLLRKIKREKEKEKKKENVVKKQEDNEKERFLQLSDREKRALAAERRILSQSGTVISRCFLCAHDITGKVPFEYSGNRFCSVECLKAHRLKTPIVLSV